VAGLDAIHQTIRSCRECNLCSARTNAVPGEGSSSAEIMFIGEGPGFNEDKQGRPFVGAAGQFLNELLQSIGLDRSSVFITNMVKCRPPNNRDPFPGEIEACSLYLDEQIETIKPKIIVPLGRHALTRWFPNESIGKLRARPKRFGDVTVFPLYHPAAALHNGGLRATIEQDFAKLGALLDQLVKNPNGETPPGAQPGLLDAAPPPGQQPASAERQVEQEPSGRQQVGQQLSMF
jgi:uracil-DNA glycosylase family 4